MSDDYTKPPKSYYWIAGVALVWNLMGLGSYVSQVTMTPEMLNALPEAERALYENVPAWATSAFAIAVNAGVLGCLLLLLRKSWALPLLVLSLVAVLAQQFNTYVLMKALPVVGPVGAAFSVAVIIIGVYLVWMANDAKQRDWMT
jgi:hypothetical protein